MNRIKYPRTYHLPWSLGRTDDDKVLSSVKSFEGLEVVVTEKMDGENTTLYPDGYTHARSIDSSYHESRTYLKAWWQTVCHTIGEDDFRICGENLYARHSIAYTNLPSYFMGFSVWVERECLSWDETCEWFALLGITPVPVLYRGLFDETKIRELWTNRPDTEGYVVRLADGFSFDDFSLSVAKFVRTNHVQTDKHWAHTAMIKNEIIL